ERSAFVIEQPSFAFYAAAIAGERAVRADHPMTRHDDANRIGPIGQTNRSNGSRTSKLRRQRTIGQGLAGRDRGESGPYAALERSAGSAPFDGCETPDIALEIFPQ